MVLLLQNPTACTLIIVAPEPKHARVASSNFGYEGQNDLLCLISNGLQNDFFLQYGGST